MEGTGKGFQWRVQHVKGIETGPRGVPRESAQSVRPEEARGRPERGVGAGSEGHV